MNTFELLKGLTSNDVTQPGGNNPLPDVKAHGYPGSAMPDTVRNKPPLKFSRVQTQIRRSVLNTYMFACHLSYCLFRNWAKLIG
jgi:hypothetical protein